MLGIQHVGVEELILGEALDQFGMIDRTGASLGFSGGDITAFFRNDLEISLFW
jgi:hypothetical protein